MTSLKRRIWKFTAAIIASLLILLAIGVGLFRAAVPYVPELRAQAEQAAEEALGWPVHIGQMDLRWQYLGPMLVLSDVQLLAPDGVQALVTAERIDLIFRPGDLLQESDYRPAHIRLHQPRLGIERDADGRIMLSGYLLEFDPDLRLDWRTLLRRLLKHGRLTIFDGTLHYRDIPLGIEDWAIREFELSAASDGNDHEFSGSFLPPGPLGEQAAFSIDAEGPAGEPEAWDWSASAGARRISFNWLYEQLRWAGEGRFDGTVDFLAEFEGFGMEEVRGNGRFAADALGFVPGGAVFAQQGGNTIDHAGFDWTAETGAAGWAIDIEELVVERGERSWSGEHWHASDLDENIDEEGRRVIELAASELRLEDVLIALEWLPQDMLADETKNALIGMQPRGDVSGLQLRLYVPGQNEERPPEWNGSAAAQDFSLAAWRDYPGVDGLDFTVSGSSDEGRLELDTRDGVLDLRPLFRDSFRLDRVQGLVTWQRPDSGIRLEVRDIQAGNSDASLSAAGSISIDADGAVATALSGKVRNAGVAAAPTYLPVEIMPDELVEWLDKAFPAGRIPEADWQLQGPLADFPWRNGNGVFDIRFPIEGLTLVYDDDWPAVADATVDVHFRQQALDVIARSGSTAGLPVAGVKARFADLETGELVVNGPTSGDADHAFEFLAASPLREPLRGLLDKLSVSGPFSADVNLDLPLATIDESAIDIRARLESVNVTVDGLPWTASDISGPLDITRRSVSADRLTGTLTGNPLVASIRSMATDGDISEINVELDGRTPVGEFDRYLPGGWSDHLDGTLDWDGVLALNMNDDPDTFSIRSDLQSVSSTLPAPMDTLSPSSAIIRLPDAGSRRIDAGIQMPGRLAGRLGFVEEDDDSGWRLERGEIRSGADAEPEMPDRSGLVISGRVAKLPVLAWVFLDEDAPDDGGENILRAVDIAADLLQVGNLEFPAQRMSGERLQESWSFSMQGPVQGAMRLPLVFDADHVAELNLAQLHIGTEAIDEDALADAESAEPVPEPEGERAPDPRLLPSVRLDVESLRIGELDFGHVTGFLRRTSIGLVTDELHAQDEAFSAVTSGRWEYINNEHYTSINTRIESTDLEATLERFGYRGGLDADEATIEANLSWPASPAGWDIGIIEGRVGFRFEDGQLRDVSPGAGRMVGLFSISALPRRLLLDFSDLFGQGLAFDELKGDYLITGGNAYTTNVQLEGASIKAWLVGRTGLAARDYDQVAIADPGVSSSIPVAGYLAAGPTVGAALLLASQVLKSPLSDITQVKYRITGSWDDPVIEEVKTPRRERADEDNR